MRMTKMFSRTLRESPSEAEVASHQLLLRAGFIRQLASGVFSYLPLARRSMDKIENIIRDEMNAIGGQEITMPVVQPAELWQDTGRWYQIDAEMTRFKDRTGRDLVLGMTHEEVVTELVRKEIRSYRQLPALIYQIQTKWRDDPRPRAGLIRVREFTMEDSYSLDLDEAGLDLQYRRHYQAYFNIFRRCGIDVLAVKADTGMMGGKVSHEYIFLTPIGEDSLMVCDACGYAANRQVARFAKPAADDEMIRAVEKVETPNCKTIEDLANFLGVAKAKTAKAVMLMATVNDGVQKRDQFVFAVVRGDMELNETKLANAVQARELRPATEAEIRAVGAEPGYASPVGLKGVLVAADDSLSVSPNLAAGANQAGFHLLNTNLGRDWQADIVTDLVSARAGDACVQCGAILRMVRGVEVGNIFQLGTRYSEALGATYVDCDGTEKPVVMGSYGIGVGRLLACVAEQHHDEDGLMWPATIAPFDVQLILLANKKDQQAVTVAERIYTELMAAGVSVLYDDRDESPGVRFKDADLIGLPLRLTVSDRALQAGGVELKLRASTQKEFLPVEEVTARVRFEMERLRTEIAQSLRSEMYL